MGHISTGQMPMKFDLKLVMWIIVIVAALTALTAYMMWFQPYPVSERDSAVFACVFLCKAERDTGRLLSNGPCLSGSSSWKVADWVCDVAHDPRIASDNVPANQCKEYGVTASHFVEVTPECEFIRAV
jgi:hypothetical protein